MATNSVVTFNNTSINIAPISSTVLQDFFDTYLKDYPPYNNNPIFDVLLDNICKKYYTELYVELPKDLQELFYNLNISNIKIYDYLLVAVGLPAEIISKISLHDKIIFLKSLNDYEQYKGTLSFLIKLGTVFRDKVNISELYIDFNKLSNKWKMKPVPLFRYDESIPNNFLDINYLDVYNIIPTTLISIHQLNTLRNKEEIILPIKSNILLMEYNLSQNTSMLNSLISCVALHTYKNSSYSITCANDHIFFLTLRTICSAWYYLLSLYYEYNTEATPTISAIQFNFLSNYPLDPSKTISLILKDYDDINIIPDTLTPREKLNKFYNTYINPFFNTYNQKPLTVKDLYINLSSMNLDFCNFINDRLKSLSGDLLQQEMILIFNEIFTSLAENKNNVVNLQYILDFFPQPLQDPTTTTTSIILSQLKPYHTEIYNIYNDGIICNDDKFNELFIEDSFSVILSYKSHSSSVAVSDDFNIIGGLDYEPIVSLNFEQFETTEFIETTTTTTEFLVSNIEFTFANLNTDVGIVRVLKGFDSTIVSDSDWLQYGVIIEDGTLLANALNYFLIKCYPNPGYEIDNIIVNSSLNNLSLDGDLLSLDQNGFVKTLAGENSKSFVINFTEIATTTTTTS